LIRRRAQSPASRNKEFRTLVIIMAAVALPLTIEFVLLTADMLVDLSDMKPAQTLVDPNVSLIGWPDLATEAQRGNGKPRVRMLGYMMDGYMSIRDGESVEMFMLMPEAGQFLHPAHRIPDQMVEVWVKSRVPFEERSLVWVSGVLTLTPRQNGEHASYAMRNALVEPAIEGDLKRWFKP
jgi:hypothetical protein